jgi:hypothetical protein
LDIQGAQAGKISQDRLGRISRRKACKHGTWRDPRSFEDRFSTTDVRVTNDALVEMYHNVAKTSHILPSSLAAYLSTSLFRPN